MSTKCPATMCPLFAADGSPWTGEKDADCEGKACGWWQGFGGCACDGANAAYQQVAELTVHGRTLVIGKDYSPRTAKPTTYDCAAASVCQWQQQATSAQNNLCPPRLALSLGLDPRACAW